MSNNVNINSFLVNTKDKVPILPKSGIYALSCTSCNAVYVGQRSRRMG